MQHGNNYFIYNLAAASKLIEAYVAANKKLNNEEKVFLQDLVKKIHAIEHTLRGWLVGDQLATYHLVRDKEDELKEMWEDFHKESEEELKEKYSQDELLKESKRTHENMLVFTYIQTKKIKKSLKKFRESREPFQSIAHSNKWESAKVFHQELDKCLQAVLESIDKEANLEKETKIVKVTNEYGKKENIKKHSYIVHFNEREEKLLSGKLNILKIAARYGAIFYPMPQSLNPLAGGEEEENKFNNRGMCAGFVKAWGDEIREKRKYWQQPVGDEKVSYYQKNNSKYVNDLKKMRENKKLKMQR